MSIKIFLIAILVVLLVSFSNGEPVMAQSQRIPVASLLNPDGSINMTTGAVGTVDLRGWKVTLDSKRGPILTPRSEPAAPSAAQPSDEWWALPHNGLNNTVYALAVMGIGPFFKVYVGGEYFHTTDGVDLGNIAVFDAYSGVWSKMLIGGLGQTCPEFSCFPTTAGSVYAFSVSGNDLYVGGSFALTTDTQLVYNDLNKIAKLDTVSNTWSAAPHLGLNGNVNALAVIGTTIYAGGDFLASYDGQVTSLKHIAKLDGTNWSALPRTGLSGTVYALAVSESDLYAGGAFTQTADSVVSKPHIAKLSGGNWVALSDGLNNDVFALAVNGSDLYVGGLFTETSVGAGTNLNRIAVYDTVNNTWSALANHGLSGAVLSLAVVTPCPGCLNVVYVGGGFSQTADGSVVNLHHIAKLHLVLFQGMVWSALPNQGLNGAVNAMARIGGDLYVGGVFTQSQDGAVTNLNRIAKLAPQWQQFLPFVKR